MRRSDGQVTQRTSVSTDHVDDIHLSVHHVSMEDVTSGQAAPTGSIGMLVGGADVVEHALLAQICGREYCKLHTRGDGACGLHAAPHVSFPLYAHGSGRGV